MLGRIIDYNGDAVGEDKEEGQLNRICDERVASLLPGARVFPADLGYGCTVDLVSAYRMGGIFA